MTHALTPGSTNDSHYPDAREVALVTVHIDEDTVAQMCQAAFDLPWTVVPLNYDNYFSTGRLPALTQRGIQAQACVAVVDFEDPESAIETAECLRQVFYHKIAIVALSSGSDPDLLLRAMRAGYSEFLGKPFNPEDFADTLGRLDRRWSSSGIGRPQHSGKVISFFGAKGGVGTTTLAVHLAMFLVTAYGRKVLLIDNHAQLGHVALYLGMSESNHHFYDLVQNVSRLDQELLRGFVATHPSGLDVLSSPDVYGGLWKTDTESVDRTLEFLATQYDFVVLDCEASFEDINLAVIALSDWIYLIATPEIGAIRDLSRYVDGLIQNEQAIKKLRLVINRYSSSEAVRIEQIEKAVRLPIALKIANNYGQLVQAINIGEPLAAGGKSEFSAQMTQWAASLAGADKAKAPEPAKKKFALWK